MGIGVVFGPREIQDSVGFLDEIPRSFDKPVVLIKQMAVCDHVSWKKFAIAFRSLAFFDLGNTLGGNQDLENEIPHLLGLNAAQHVVPDLLFKAGTDMDDVPLITRCGDGSHSSLKLVEKCVAVSRPANG